MTVRILIVEDDLDIQMLYKECLETLEIVSAFTKAQALEEFVNNPDFAAIVMDACVPGNEVNTLGLVYRFRRTFNGPMIATSSEPNYNDKLMKAGCDHKSEKHALPQKLREILGLK